MEPALNLQKNAVLILWLCRASDKSVPATIKANMYSNECLIWTCCSCYMLLYKNSGCFLDQGQDHKSNRAVV